MDNKINALILQFPEHSEIIHKQLDENEDFQALCYDYELCITKLASFEKDSVLKHYKIMEYLELKKELEDEVLKYLK
jgi:hypothetical protein